MKSTLKILSLLCFIYFALVVYLPFATQDYFLLILSSLLTLFVVIVVQLFKLFNTNE
jgi:hypothetical protein